MSWDAVHFDRGLSGANDQIQRAIDLLEADEVLEREEDVLYARKYKRGSGQSILLLQKVVKGSTCADDVSLTGG